MDSRDRLRSGNITLGEWTYGAVRKLRFIYCGEIAALVRLGLFRFELLACHLTTDQASKRPEGLICADGNHRSVSDPNLFVPFRHESKKILRTNGAELKALQSATSVGALSGCDLL